MPKEAIKSLLPEFYNSPPEQESLFFARKKSFTATPRLLNNLFHFPNLFVDAFGVFLDFAGAEVERLRLELDPVYRGKEKPTGDGSTIVILPGFGMWEGWYADTKRYFQNAGFAPVTYICGVFNNGSWATTLNLDLAFIHNKYQFTKNKLNIVAHSLSGYLMRIAAEDWANELENSVGNIFLVGAPITQRVNLVIETSFLISQLPFGGQQLDNLLTRIRNLKQPPNLNNVNVFEVESRRDLIVEGKNGQGENQIFFDSSHAGLLKDPDVLRFISQKLTENLAVAA